MDFVKLKGRANKIQLGYRVSVPNDFFGKAYQKSLMSLGFTTKIYGCVVDVYDENRQFSIKWDLDQQVTHDHKIGSVQVEASDTPFQ